MTEHRHDYRKLNDDAVFCRGCGDIKTITPPVCTLHYPFYPWPSNPSYPWWQVSTYPTWTPTWTVVSDSASGSSTVVSSSDSVTIS